MAHVCMPFNLERHGIFAGSGRQEDYVLKHPIVMAEGEEHPQYKSKHYPPSPRPVYVVLD
eukprot:652777-Rhodomonas_salina.1